MPATTRVVQIEPGPIPTLTASTPHSIIAFVPSAVAMLPAITCKSGYFSFTKANVFNTLAECPCAVSITITST